MLRSDRTALVCDLMETYGVYDLKALPGRTVAALSAGLRNDSRIRMKMSGSKLTVEQSLLINIADTLTVILWSKTKDAAKGRNKPELISDRLRAVESEDDVMTFESSAEFEKYRREVLTRIRNNG